MTDEDEWLMMLGFTQFQMRNTVKPDYIVADIFKAIELIFDWDSDLGPSISLFNIRRIKMEDIKVLAHDGSGIRRVPVFKDLREELARTRFEYILCPQRFDYGINGSMSFHVLLRPKASGDFEDFEREQIKTYRTLKELTWISDKLRGDFKNTYFHTDNAPSYVFGNPVYFLFFYRYESEQSSKAWVNALRSE